MSGTEPITVPDTFSLPFVQFRCALRQAKSAACIDESPVQHRIRHHPIRGIPLAHVDEGLADLLPHTPVPRSGIRSSEFSSGLFRWIRKDRKPN